MSTFTIKRLAILGLGLIGGSLALAARKAKIAQEIIGYGRSEKNLLQAQQLGAIDHYSLSVTAAVKDADIVVIAVPVNAIKSLLQSIKSELKADAILTDVGSVKQSIMKDVEEVFGKDYSQFVPAHPIAGSEKSGIAAAQADLFVKHKVVITPMTQTSSQACAAVRLLWAATGADVVEMSAQRHDDYLALTSHLPHLLAYSFMDTLAASVEVQAMLHYAAGGFRDFTRLAASDPVMWHDIFMANKTALLQQLESFCQQVEKLTAAIAQNDSAKLLGVLQSAKNLRDQFTLVNKN